MSRRPSEKVLPRKPRDLDPKNEAYKTGGLVAALKLMGPLIKPGILKRADEGK